MGKWIPCAEQLPDSDTTVIIHTPAASSEPVFVGYHDGEGWYELLGAPVTVTHWQPLPDPPSEPSDRSEKSDPSDPEEVLP